MLLTPLTAWGWCLRELTRLCAPMGGATSVGESTHTMILTRCHRCLHHGVGLFEHDSYPDAGMQCPRCKHLTSYGIAEVKIDDFQLYGPAVPVAELTADVVNPRTSVPRFSERRPRRR